MKVLPITEFLIGLKGIDIDCLCYNIIQRNHNHLYNHFFSELILVRLPSTFGGIYFGRLPLNKYDQYISAVSIISLPRFSLPYSTGV
jgi:hypothetical protein